MKKIIISMKKTKKKKLKMKMIKKKTKLKLIKKKIIIIAIK